MPPSTHLRRVSLDLKPTYQAPRTGREVVRTTRQLSDCAANAGSELLPFLDYDVEIQRVRGSTNVVESLVAHDRTAIKPRGGHLPTEQVALNACI